MGSSKTFRHYYPDCDSKEYYDDGDCKVCKTKKVTEYSVTDKGKLIREKYAAKQRLIRRVNRVKEITENIKSDVNILGLNDTYSKELEDISILIKQISDINLQIVK
jgi:hypothetical protein